MEKKSLEKLFETMRAQQLTAAQRAAVRQRVVLFMREHPAADVSGGSWFERVRVVLSKPVPVKLKYAMPILLILALLASGGGVSYAAQGSLPGDPLYAVKVDINEPLAGLFQVSPQAKAEWNASLAQTRLQEAERLAAENKLSPQLQAQVTQRMETAVTAAQNDVMRLVQQNKIAVAAQINNELETTLRVHAEVLTRLADRNQNGDGSNGNGNENDTQNVASATVRQAQRVAGVSDQMNASTTEQVRTNGPQAQSAVMNKGDEARSFIDGVVGLLGDQGASLDATTSAQVRASLMLAQQKMASGDAANRAGNYAQAFGDYQAAQQAAQDAKVQIVATHTYRTEFEHQNRNQQQTVTSSPLQIQNQQQNQEQNVNASSSAGTRNQETEQNQHREQIGGVSSSTQTNTSASGTSYQNASTTTSTSSQSGDGSSQTSGGNDSSGGGTSGGDGNQQGGGDH